MSVMGVRLGSAESPSENPDGEGGGEYLWRCVHTKPKCEHIAAKHICLLDEVEVFCPRVRFCRRTRRGKVWFVEAMFPGYVFAKFDTRMSLRAVNAAHAVTRVVRFGLDYSVIPDGVVRDLRENFDEQEVITVLQTFAEGDEVEVAEGPLRGSSAVVTKLLPGKDRVRILLDFLGNPNEIEVSLHTILGLRNARGEALPSKPAI